MSINGTFLSRTQTAKAARAVGCTLPWRQRIFRLYLEHLLTAATTLSHLDSTHQGTVTQRALNSTISTAAIITVEKDRQRTQLESIKTCVCLLQEKHLFCICKNLNIATKQPREIATQNFPPFNVPLQGRGF